MSYEIKLNRFTLKDELAANALSIGFKGKKTFEEIRANIEIALSQNPLTCSKVVLNDGVPYFEKIDRPNINFEAVTQTDKVWITKQYSKPLNIGEGELLRFALVGENTFVIYYHPILSDSRGMVTFARRIISGDLESSTDFYFPEIKDTKLSLIDKQVKRSLEKAKNTDVVFDEETEFSSIKLKSVSLKSDIVYRICSAENITMLSFFITTALSLNKTKRKKLLIPYCRKNNNEDSLINDSVLFSFKRGFEPRLSFYDNGGEIDKLFESIIIKKSYEKREAILEGISQENLNDPTKIQKLYDFLHADLMFDVLTSIDEDDIINTMNYYPSSSYVTNNFGISAVGGRLIISTVLHNKEGEDFFGIFSTTINLLAKEAAKRFKDLK